MSDVQNMIRRIQKENGIPEYGPFWHLFVDDGDPNKQFLYGDEELRANCLIDLLYHTGHPANDQFVMPGERACFTTKKMFQGGPVEVSVPDGKIAVRTVAGLHIFGDLQQFCEYIKKL